MNKGIFLKLWSNVSQIFLFSLYFSSFNRKYLKLTEMDITHFAMKLFICFYFLCCCWCSFFIHICWYLQLPEFWRNLDACFVNTILIETGTVERYKQEIQVYTLASNKRREKIAGNILPGIASQFAMHFLYDCYTRYLLCSSFPS